MAKKTKKKSSKFKVRVVYGFLNKLEIVLLGEIQQGKVKEGQVIHAELPHETRIGGWEIMEVLNMDFINGSEDKNFVGLLVKCKDKADFKLLQSLRVYEETIVVE